MSITAMQVRVTHTSRADLEEQILALAAQYFGHGVEADATMGMPKGVPEYVDDNSLASNYGKAITHAEWVVDVTITLSEKV